MNEVGGAVEGVDDPEVVGPILDGLATEGETGLLTQKAVARVGGREDLDDGGLAGLVDLGDEIVLVFSRHPQAVDVETGAVDDRAGATSGLDRGVEHRMHDNRL